MSIIADSRPIDRGERTPHDSRLVLLAWAVMLVAIGLGLWARFKGLGKWSLADDESIFAMSVRNILERGLPEYASGGFYVRGLAYQYLQALVLRLLDLGDERSLRIVNALTNVAAFPALYLLARRIGGRVAACLAVALFSLSIWEVETARYARMYAPFQTVFLWYLLAFYRAVVDRDLRACRWMYALSVLAIFVYEGAIFLTLMNFLPHLRELALRNWPRWLAPGAILAGAFLFMRTNFRRLGVEGYLPPDLPMPTQAAPRKLLPIVDDPKLFLTTLDRPLWIVLLGLLTVALAWLAYRLIRTRAVSPSVTLALIGLGFLAWLNLNGLLLGLALILWLVGVVRFQDLRPPEVRWFLLGAGALPLFWLAYGMLTDACQRLFPGELFHPLKKTLVVLIKYPDFYLKIVHEWLIGIPTTSLLSLLAIALGLLASRWKEETSRTGYRMLVALLVGTGLLVAALPLPYSGARYTFFLYAVVILLSAVGLVWVASSIGRLPIRAIALVALAAAYVWLADDYGLRHLLRVDAPEVNFRLIHGQDRQYHYWFRVDFKTPALIVNENSRPGDRVVVVRAGPTSYYLDRLDFYYRPATHFEFFSITADRGRRELWTNAPLLYREEQLEALLGDGGSTIWLILYSERFPHVAELEERLARRYRKDRFYRSIDGRLDVYRIEPNRATDAPSAADAR